MTRLAFVAAVTFGQSPSRPVTFVSGQLPAMTEFATDYRQLDNDELCGFR